MSRFSSQTEHELVSMALVNKPDKEENVNLMKFEVKYREESKELPV